MTSDRDNTTFSVHDTPVSEAVCGSCNRYREVYMCPEGLRCEECLTDLTESPVDTTFAPSYRATDRDDRNSDEETIQNIEKFEDEILPNVCFSVELQDGSVYEMDTYETAAVLLKHGDNWEAFLHSLASKVAEHFEKETEPTKFAEYAHWGTSKHEQSQETYDSHKELAPVVAYATLRGAKMQLGLMAMSYGDNETMSVIQIGDESATRYTSEGRITIDYDSTGETEFPIDDKEDGDINE